MTKKTPFIAGLVMALPLAAALAGETTLPVEVRLYENLPAARPMETPEGPAAEAYEAPAFSFVRLPAKTDRSGIPLDRSVPFLLVARMPRPLEAGEWEVRLRARGAARLSLDGKPILTTKPQKANGSAHDHVPAAIASAPGVRPPAAGHQEAVVRVTLPAGTHEFALAALIGGKGLYPSPGELTVSIGRPGEIPRLLGPEHSPRLTDEEFEAHRRAEDQRLAARDDQLRRGRTTPVVQEWSTYHARVRQWLAGRKGQAVPAGSVRHPIDAFINQRLQARKQAPTAPIGDLAFLRRLFLDVTGVIPTPAEIRRYLDDPAAQRRKLAVRRLLADERWADGWMPYWQDVLAENPGILKPDLNNSGPFRWWLHQSFRDDLPFDRIAAELVQMEGSVFAGGPAAFGVSALNDSPMAAKAHIVAGAFLAQNLTCARCHDAPGHPFEQRDLFSLAAMLNRKPLAVPETSTVKVAPGARQPLVRISLKPGEQVAPAWPFRGEALSVPPFPGATTAAEVQVASTRPTAALRGVDSRRELAGLLISPANERFAEVLVNRIWARYLGRGLVEPVDDWHQATPSHPELLKWLGREFVRSGYSLKHLAELIFTSDLYARAALKSAPLEKTPADRTFAGPYGRRMSAEQVVDSLYAAVGKRFDSEELNLSPLGDKEPKEFLNLGDPTRAWQFTALMNERDRPALALPVSQSIVDVLSAYGWRSSRQSPASYRDDAPSPMQSLLLANGPVGARIVRLSDDGALVDLALQARDPATLIRETFLRLLSRAPEPAESRKLSAYLTPAFAGRVVSGAPKRAGGLRTDRRVSWANHLNPEATSIRMEEERRLRLGDEPTARLSRSFRERYEDVLWALVNSPEFVVVP